MLRPEDPFLAGLLPRALAFVMNDLPCKYEFVAGLHQGHHRKVIRYNGDQ